MARAIRKKSGTGIYHVMLRGINRQDIFEDEGDYIFEGSLRGMMSRGYGFRPSVCSMPIA